MPIVKDPVRFNAESERRIRAHTPRAQLPNRALQWQLTAPYPLETMRDEALARADGKGPTVWRRSAKHHLIRGAKGWLATIVPVNDNYQLVVGKHLQRAEKYSIALPGEGWSLRISRSKQVIAWRMFECANEAMAVGDEVMSG